MNKAIFLDRDGTINVDKGYIYKKEDFEFLPNVKEALYEFQKMGYLLIIVTNQSGIARGYYTEEEYIELARWMKLELSKENIYIKKEFYCPHHENAIIESYRKKCECRKPSLGMYKKAIEEFDLDPSECIAVGDKFRDCAVALELPMNAFLIGNNEKNEVINAVKNGKYNNIKYENTLYDVLKRIKYGDY